ncbi:hypothetical protein F0U44_04695 [Nocardioides humilatus]|uniref:Fibronectin type-III domain-containing protein n=1 Tax=Nocardioides humilatus TaxID=2607660 RepID=A0A5B1LM43_9ACTN|nr:fibronectin type III domain-containing protein [Nocardioides humilatus]KAA1421584.1 hypothetical protein F0U44_04695 [Nocardioides humilatus]
MTTNRTRRIVAGALPLATALSGAFLATAAPTHAAPSAPTASLAGATNGVIAFSDDRDGNREIYTVHADGTGITRLTNDAAPDVQPRWSPNGRQIAYLHASQLWVMDADGTDAHQVTGYADDAQLSWSPDGTRLAYAKNGSIWVVDADGTDAHVVVVQVNPGYSLESPDWSPNGNRIAYLRGTGPGAATVHSVRPDGTGDVEVSASFGHTPRWSPDGKQIAFEELGLTVQTPGVDDADRVYFLQGSDGILRGLTWSPDQTRFAFAQNAWTGSTWTHPAISTIAVDGTGLTPVTQGWTPDWQPVLPVTRPGAPTGVTAVGATSTSARVSFAPPARDGNSEITSYLARCQSPDGGVVRTKSGTTSPVTVPNLTLGKTYQCQVRAINGVGGGAFSALTAAFPLAASAPTAPRTVTATPTGTTAKVSFLAPASNGGSPVTSYLVHCVSTDGGVTRSVSGAASPLTVTGLTSGKSYRCEVRATNAAGTSPFSTFSATFSVA